MMWMPIGLRISFLYEMYASSSFVICSLVVYLWQRFLTLIVLIFVHLYYIVFIFIPFYFIIYLLVDHLCQRFLPLIVLIVVQLDKLVLQLPPFYLNLLEFGYNQILVLII